ncbi:MAG: ATP-binding protein [Desulfobacterales bacterium]
MHRRSILISTVAVSCLYWACESFMFFFLAPEANFIQHLLGPDRFNTLTRILVLCLFAIFGSHIHYTIRRERQSEEALEKSAAKYRSILESIEEGYFETDLEGRLSFANGPFARMLGTENAAIPGGHAAEFMAPESGARLREALERVRTSREAQRLSDCVIPGKEGAERRLELSLSLIADEKGCPVGFRGVVRDVTERHHAEEERKKLAVQLQAAQKMEAIGTLAGGIAHDFNNILMGIQGNASLLEMRLPEGHPGLEKVKNIEAYVESGTELSRQLLGFARRGRVDVRATDLNAVIEKTVGLFARTRKDIRVHFRLSPNLPAVEADRGQIEQVLMNLCVNAVQAMPGGGDLTLATEAVNIDEAYSKPYQVKPGRYVKVSVTDTGVGIEKKNLGRIFEPFFTTKEMGRGTGLGLASAYGIIKGHGGHINVYSEVGRGTTFNFYLPASAQPAQREKPARGPVIRRGEGTVLLVDDEETILQIAGEMLRELGYTVIVARSGAEALEAYAARSGEIDAVVLDMVMPGMGGGELFDRLRAIDPGVKVLLASGFNLNGQAAEILSRGCRGFIQKPFNLEQLSHKLAEIIPSGETAGKTTAHPPPGP